MEPRLLRSINRNVMLLRHHNVRSQASYSSFSTTVPRHTGRFFPDNFAKCWVILKILSKQTQQ